VSGFIGLSTLSPVQWDRSIETIVSGVFQWEHLIPLDEGWLCKVNIFLGTTMGSW
jgi:hypothetical protein